ncbi:MAG: 8-oxo-dGTP diphosphatase [Calditrichaeota bacterium]|nr:MAG: 8-oxo-dGTP diphosphatase [Calditrichota bacterium]MBL1205178.1 8-oxo-dGTP diphosphatase [Calditrichota bacterium]NOG45008.1 8-oxo-dGTP diphosphatase [Calditrichota bacterium]
MKLATLCYVKTESHTLMVHRVKKENDMHEGKWNGLGGKIDPGESPEECVIREVKEESGLIIKNPSLKGFITFPAFDGLDDWYVFIFTANQFEGTLISDSPEGHLEWIENKKLIDLNLWDGDKIFFKWMEENRIFSAKFIYNNGHLISHNVVFY